MYTYKINSFDFDLMMMIILTDDKAALVKLDTAVNHRKYKQII